MFGWFGKKKSGNSGPMKKYKIEMVFTSGNKITYTIETSDIHADIKTKIMKCGQFNNAYINWKFVELVQWEEQ